MPFSPAIALVANQFNDESLAIQLAQQLNCEYLGFVDPKIVTKNEFVLVVDEQKIKLQQTGRKVPGPILAEFTEGSTDHRRKFGGGKGQLIAKAVGIKAGVYPLVLDATAGLGKDAFVLAALGAQVKLIERSPIVHCLLQNGLHRAEKFAQENDPELLSIIQRMNLITDSSHDYLSSLNADSFPDVIYLDPMFPEREKSAEVKKEMHAFHTLVGKDEDADLLLPIAISHVNYRVVVKRPRKAPFLNDQAPSFQLEGKSSRFDIYTIKKFPEKLN